ncbi:UDP-4-amino-4,6-dideoxy-N-acetyl-beta-L-altrosamine transaminase [Candidatus Falkowbacteria bacterium RIFCSPLOWO2_02_FULL_45_21]|uniref:UDP-4-amino-4, 6-dideoxy-N-acetyl-beta-L-altrosamine transaminase n=1 Tax=Candidatus Falkowbacteria bacterium RIFCSPLOWO2_02_FULL_45_21 TaxID=1797989 RepID=A0A1F5SCQ0_9BACT|nr:MAG: UDP-4-amino-4,6-dideoxy-N-acetyl-beta-L-altrosamine transaminase [Candidatus Falkowbacteria bacterium RIFCSPLOWO2_02_FULL_45_21]
MIPYGRQSIDNRDIQAVVKVLKSDWLTQGPNVPAFERELAKSIGAKYALVCSSGTAALHLAFLAAGLRPGDEVITTPNTFAATSNMLAAVGAKPIFCDIRLDTYNIAENKIEELINKKTKAIVPVHFAGQPCEMARIRRLAKKYKLSIIEDACHALGARYKKDNIGNGRYSDMAVFSFHPVKSITTGEGGAILTNSKKYYKKMILLRNHGIYKDRSGKNVMVELGFNYRLTDIQAALGISQLKKLDKFIQARRRVAGWYKSELADIKEIILPRELINNYSSWHIFVVRTAAPSDRDKLVKYLKDRGIGVNFHYSAVYSHPFYRTHGYKNLKLDAEDMYDRTCLTLPCYAGLPRPWVRRISRIIKAYYEKT